MTRLDRGLIGERSQPASEEVRERLFLQPDTRERDRPVPNLAIWVCNHVEMPLAMLRF